MANVNLKAAMLLNICCCLFAEGLVQLYVFITVKMCFQSSDQSSSYTTSSNEGVSLPTLMFRVPDYPKVALCEEV